MTGKLYGTHLGSVALFGPPGDHGAVLVLLVSDDISQSEPALNGRRVPTQTRHLVEKSGSVTRATIHRLMCESMVSEYLVRDRSVL